MSEATDQLDQQLRAEKEVVDLAECADRLHANPDFRRLIEHEYLLMEPARLAMEAGDPILDLQQRADSAEMSRAAGHLKRFLAITKIRGATSSNNIRALNAELDDVRAEEGRD